MILMHRGLPQAPESIGIFFMIQSQLERLDVIVAAMCCADDVVLVSGSLEAAKWTVAEVADRKAWDWRRSESGHTRSVG